MLPELLYIANLLPYQWAQLTKTVHTAQLGLQSVVLLFRLRDLSVYFLVSFVLPWTAESFPFMFWCWHNKV